MNSVIVPGSTVRMHFSLQLEDGTVVETSRPGDPVEFEMGDGTLIGGLERALYGLKTGDKQTLRISPQEGYGMRDPAHVHVLKRDSFDAELALEPGLVMGFELPTGEYVHGTVVSFDADEVRVDFNHPLAGREVKFEVEILDVETQVVANEDDEISPEF
jgi:FKBP-type peptidyl-prolyl cis-trans isomerase SlpA